MAVNYQIPNWIHGADTTGAYTKGYSLGQQGAEAAARVAEAQARLQSDANRTQVEIQLKQQSLDRDALMEQQKLEVAKAYHDQMTQLKQEELDQAQQKIKAQAQQAAQKFQAMQAYQSAIAGGADPMSATMQLFPWMSSGGQNAVIKQQMTPKEQLEPQLRTFYGEGDNTIDYLVNPKSGAAQILRPPKEALTTPAQLYHMAYGPDSVSLDDDTKKTLEGLYSDSLESLAKKKPSKTSGTATASPYPDGTQLKHKDGSMYVVKGGVPVPIDDKSSEEPSAVGDDPSAGEGE